MAEFLNGWGSTVVAVALITAVFFGALITLGRELAWVRSLADELGYDLAFAGTSGKERRASASLETERIRDEIKGVIESADRVWALKQVRGWQMRAQRLEPALAFWVDFLRQLGLLGTVLGLGLSMVSGSGDVQKLLAPLALAVWTTVAGLTYSLVLTWRFGRTIGVWADTCEKNIEAWDSRRRVTQPERAAAGTP